MLQNNNDKEKSFCNLVFAKPNRELQNLTEKTGSLLHELICSKIALQDHEYSITIQLFYRSLSFIFHILIQTTFQAFKHNLSLLFQQPERSQLF